MSDDAEIFMTSLVDEKLNEVWRIIRIVSEFTESFQTLSNVRPGVVFFGSARLREGSRHYDEAKALANTIAQKGITLITGGGPGIMEAGNRGAFDAGGESVGLNIKLPMEQHGNTYTTKSVTYRYFFIRKFMFVKFARAFIVYPGGFGTLDELFEIITLAQTGKMLKYPIILTGSEYWAGLVDWIKNTMLKEGCISEKDLDLIKIMDSHDEIAAYLETYFSNLDEDMLPRK